MTQEKALEILKSGANVFLTGEPGAGKTYTINQFTAWMDEARVPYAVTASTGIAASHIDGSTIHSWSGIGILKDLEKEDIDAIRFHKFHYRRIVAARTLILDEVSMLEAGFVDDLDKVLKAVHKNDRPFGGIQVVLVGDFFQLPPVSKGGKARFAFEAASFQEAEFEICYLTEQHRQADPVFTDVLRAMRFGSMTEEHRNVLMSRMSSEPVDTNLFTHNMDVDYMNIEKLKSLPGKEESYRMSSEGNPHHITVLKRNCLSPENLVLKKGAVVMFTANNPAKGYVNGSVGTVEDFYDDSPKVRLKDGSVVYPDPFTWKAYDEKRNAIASITQLPLRLAWAITVHKSQGMSLDAASIDLSKAFEYGHGYVAISRVRSLQGLHLAGISENAFKVNPKVLEQDKKFRELGA